MLKQWINSNPIVATVLLGIGLAVAGVSATRSFYACKTESQARDISIVDNFQLKRYRFLERSAQEYTHGNRKNAVAVWIRDSKTLLNQLLDSHPAVERQYLASSLIENMKLWLYFESLNPEETNRNCSQLSTLLSPHWRARAVTDLMQACSMPSENCSASLQNAIRQLNSTLQEEGQHLDASELKAKIRVLEAYFDGSDSNLRNVPDNFNDTMLRLAIVEAWQAFLPTNCAHAQSDVGRGQ